MKKLGCVGSIIVVAAVGIAVFGRILIPSTAIARYAVTKNARPNLPFRNPASKTREHKTTNPYAYWRVDHRRDARVTSPVPCWPGLPTITSEMIPRTLATVFSASTTNETGQD